MKKTGLFALTLVGTMALSSATPVFAEGGTEVGFSIEPPYVEYTMTIPTGNSSIATDKTFSDIGNLTVKKKDNAFDSGHKLEVTVNHSGEFKNTDESLAAANKITYALYTGTVVNEDNIISDGDIINFSAAEINAANGKSVAMGVAITGNNFATLAPGDYRDTITFTAEVKAAASGALTEAQVKNMVDAVASNLRATTHFNDKRTLANYKGSFTSAVENANFTDNGDGTYTFLLPSNSDDQEHGIPDTEWVVVIENENVASVTMKKDITVIFLPANN